LAARGRQNSGGAGATGAGTLTLAVSSPAWARELATLQEEICAAVNRALGAQLVKRVRVRMAAHFVTDAAAREKSPAAARPDAAAAIAEASAFGAAAFEHILRGVDPDIRLALSRSFAKYFARQGNNSVI
jgi:hypothetical protein